MYKLYANVTLLWAVGQLAPFDGYYGKADIEVDVEQLVAKSYPYADIIEDMLEEGDEEGLNVPAHIDSIEDFFNGGGLKPNVHKACATFGSPDRVYVSTVEVIDEDDESENEDAETYEEQLRRDNPRDDDVSRYPFRYE